MMTPVPQVRSSEVKSSLYKNIFRNPRSKLHELVSVSEPGKLSPSDGYLPLPHGLDGELCAPVCHRVRAPCVVQGEVCANPCPTGTYHVDCKRRCDCYNGAVCDHVTGKCHCLPGYKGAKVRG